MVATLLLVMAMAAAEQIDQTRLDYSNCLVDFTEESLDAKMPVADFNSAIHNTCEAEKTAFHAEVVKSERGYGSKADEAAEYADAEVESVISSKTDAYPDFLSSNSRPIKQ